MSEVAGRLDDRVTLSRPVRVDDGEGGAEVSFVALSPATVWAEVAGLRGQERMQSEALDVTITHTVRLRYHAEVTAHTRITWGTRVLEVIGPPVEIVRRALLECYCAERTAAA